MFLRNFPPRARRVAVLAMSVSAAFGATAAWSQATAPAPSSTTTALLPAPVLDTTGLSKSVAACTDFYMFANEQWLLNTKIPGDRSTWGAGSELSQRNEAVLREALESASRNPGAIDNVAIRKAVEYFISGMDTTSIEQLGAKPLTGELQRISAIKKKADLPAAFAHFNRLGIAAPVAFDVTQDEKDATHYMVVLSQGGLGLPERDFYFTDDAKSEEWRIEYRRHIGNMFVLLGQNEGDAKRDAEIVFALEKKLAAASMTAVQQRDPQAIYNPRRVARLVAEAPGMSWSSYFLEMKLRAPGRLNVAQPKFMSEVAKLANTEPLEHWKTYLRWHLLRNSAPKMAAAFEKENFRFYDGVLDGKQQQPARYRVVVKNIGDSYGNLRLGEGLSQLFVAKAFPPEAKAKALALVGNLKLALKERIEGLDWMKPVTKKRAQEKLAAMQIKIGYPDKWQDFSTVNVDSKAYLANTWTLNQRDFDRKIARLGKPVDRSVWEMGTYIVNAYYNANLNEIVFPAGILQPPYFNAAADDAVNYGAIGMVIGHEITHGFDDAGRQYDAKGNLKDWWTKDDAKQYLARTAEVVKQFNAYEGVEGLKVNGKLTLGENISDLGGLKIAFMALQKANSAHTPASIDGYTADQRFFLSYAQSWRSLARPEVERVRLTSDGHSPARFRVKGPVANSPEFAKAFSCKPGDAALQSAAQRVNIW
ncbi:MAG: M13 family metallopeptidase [Betaproteobacteria bacterium]